MKKLFSLTAAIILLSLAVVQASVSVPNLVNFQGRLTDGAGTPVADGAYGVTFRLYTAPSGGSLVWAETSLVTTNNGVFNHNLGEDNSFDVTFFQDYDSLFLEIVVGGETMTPRSRLTSAPYTRLAGGIEVPSNSTSPETLAIATLPNIHNFIVFGNDGKRNVEIGGTGFGEVWLRDGTAGNNLIVDLTATTNSGGSLILNKSGGSSGVDLNAGVSGGGSTLNMRNDVGSVTVSFDADGSGNTAAVLPTGSISDAEILDEPGIAHEYNSGLVSLTGTTTAYDTVTITVPTSGYIVVTAHASFTIDHTNGVDDLMRMSISKTAGIIDFDNAALWRGNIQNPTNTGFDEFLALSCTKVEAVSSGTHTYFLNADAWSGSGELWRRHLTAMFFPTAYGTVVSTLASKSADGRSVSSVDGVQSLTESELTTITVEEHNARMEAELEKMRTEIEARLQKLERQINPGSSTPGAE